MLDRICKLRLSSSLTLKVIFHQPFTDGQDGCHVTGFVTVLFWECISASSAGMLALLILLGNEVLMRVKKNCYLDLNRLGNWPSLPKVVLLHKHITQNNHFVRNSQENISLNKAVIASKELQLLFFFFFFTILKWCEILQVGSHISFCSLVYI